MEALRILPVLWSGAALNVLAAAHRGSALGVLRVEELPAQAQLFEVSCDGRPVAYYAIALNRHAAGVEGVIVAAAGRMPGCDLTASVMPAIERQLAQCEVITVHTARRGLAKKLARQGYQFDGWILRKRAGERDATH